MESVDRAGNGVLRAARTTPFGGNQSDAAAIDAAQLNDTHELSAPDQSGPAVVYAARMSDTNQLSAAESGATVKPCGPLDDAGVAESSCTSDAASPADACSGTSVDDLVPLPRLLAEAEALFAVEFDRRVRSSEFPNLSLAHARNVLRHLGQEPRRASAIVADCGVSKQALSQQIALLEHEGLLTVHADPRDARARLLSLTPMGVRAQHLVRDLFREIEDDWAADLGVDDLAAIRRALRTLLARRRTANERTGTC